MEAGVNEKGGGRRVNKIPRAPPALIMPALITPATAQNTAGPALDSDLQSLINWISDPVNTFSQPTDGNCLYHALGFALGGVPHGRLRSSVQSYMRCNKDYFDLIREDNVLYQPTGPEGGPVVTSFTTHGTGTDPDGVLAASYVDAKGKAVPAWVLGASRALEGVRNDVVRGDEPPPPPLSYVQRRAPRYSNSTSKTGTQARSDAPPGTGRGIIHSASGVSASEGGAGARMSWEVYIEQVGCDRFWGGSAELAAVRELADRPIFILSANALDVDLVRTLQQSIEARDDPIVLLYNGTHYNSVILPCMDGNPSAPIRASALFF